MDNGGNGSERSFVDRPGPSRLVREVVNDEDEFTNSKIRRTSYNSLRNDPNSEVHVENNADDDEELQIIQESTGIVQRDANGEMFVLMEDGDGNEMSVEYVEEDHLDQIHYSPIRASSLEPVYQSRNLVHIPQGLKARKNRQYGNCKCPECGASFVNTARLERHLSVHQVFGSFLCPLCAKTYKYEYNLFYHWRKTCKDLDELIPTLQRNEMDVATLRQLVDEVVKKKADFGPVDIGVSKSVLFQSGPLSRLEMPSNPLGKRGSSCRACGIVVYTNHMPKHLALHQGEGLPDERAVTGGYVCDLCGTGFRQHCNLIKHWKSGCPEIQANTMNNAMLLSDNELRHVVADLLKRAVTIQLDRLVQPKQDFGENTNHNREVGGSDEPNRLIMDRYDEGTAVEVNQRQSNWENTDQAVVFADDFDEDMEGVLEGSMALIGQENREKWRVGGPGSLGLQCPECFRTFANVGRLERHIAGFHASFGSHHCVLCGNRFKYDYNLLYHYRRSCPYTKTFIQSEIRENVDAPSLRRAVRNLAYKEVKLSPQMKPETLRLIRERHPKTNNDTKVRKEMFKYPGHGGPPPPQLLTPRHGVPGAEACPVCGVFFYGKKSLDRHVQNAHGLDPSEPISQNPEIQIVNDERNFERREEYLVEYLDDQEEDDVLEPPPQLERHEPVQQSPSREIDNCAIMFLDGEGNPNMDLDEGNASVLSQMFERGEVNVGDRITVTNQGLLIQFNVISFSTNKRPWSVTIVKEATVPSLEDDSMYEELLNNPADHNDGHSEFGSAILEEEVTDIHEIKTEKRE
ncbi:unnamed protein product [Auanema sp. JU1783]|nr:unnamed protein product [Auanema sp. JU1783]